MKKLSMTPEEYQKVEQAEYLEAESRPEECGLLIDYELEQCSLMDLIITEAQGAKDVISNLERGLVDLDSVPFTTLRNNYTTASIRVAAVDEIFSRLNEDYQEVVKVAYKSFSKDTLHLMKALESKLTRQGAGE